MEPGDNLNIVSTKQSLVEKLDTRSEQSLPNPEVPCLPTDLILIEPFNNSEPYPEHPTAHEQYGMTAKIDDDANNAMIQLIAKIAKKIITGKFDLLTVIPPAKMLAPRSHLNVLSLDYLILMKYLEASVQAVDPLEKFKLIVAGYIANIYYSTWESKGKSTIPTFPGEILEGVLQNGTYFQGSHVSRVPPTVKMNIKGPNGNWDLQTELTSHGMPKSMGSKILGTKNGPNKLTYKDGSEYTFTYPNLWIESAQSKTKHFSFFTEDNEPVIIKDKMNKYVAVITFEKKKASLWSEQFSRKKIPTCYEKNQVDIKICSMDGGERPQHTLCRGTANYLSYVELDGMCYWRVSDGIESWDLKKNGMNNSGMSTVNKEYIKFINERNWVEADKELLCWDSRGLAEES